MYGLGLLLETAYAKLARRNCRIILDEYCLSNEYIAALEYGRQHEQPRNRLPTPLTSRGENYEVRFISFFYRTRPVQ